MGPATVCARARREIAQPLGDLIQDLGQKIDAHEGARQLRACIVRRLAVDAVLRERPLELRVQRAQPRQAAPREKELRSFRGPLIAFVVFVARRAHHQGVHAGVARRHARGKLERVRARRGAQRHRPQALGESLLEALRQRHLLLAGEQLGAAHLAHVGAHQVRGGTRIIGARGQGGGEFVERRVLVLDALERRKQQVPVRRLVDDLDAQIGEHRDHGLERVDVAEGLSERVAQLVVGQVALLTSPADRRPHPRSPDFEWLVHLLHVLQCACAP